MEKHKNELPTTAMTGSPVSVKPYALVTGGTGFIGSTLVDWLLAEGYAVTVPGDLSRGKPEDPQQISLNDDFELITTDALEVDRDELLERSRPEVIFRLAVQANAWISMVDPVWDATLNIIDTIRFANATRKHGVRKVALTSSGGSIYGMLEESPVPGSVSVDLVSLYAVSKVTGELYLNTLRSLYGLECSHTAPANMYGPRQDPYDEADMVAISAQRLLTGEPTEIFDGGGNTRSYVYADDVMGAFHRTSGEAGGGMRLNIGTDMETSDRQLHPLMVQAADAEDNPELAPPRTGDVTQSALGPAWAHGVLDWEPAMNIHEGAVRIVECFRN